MAKRGISRRSVVASAAFVPLSAIKCAAEPSVFTPEQRRTLEAFIDRLVPKDDNGPGASECGAAKYIELSMADFLSAEKTAFLAGLESIDRSARAKFDGAFAELAADRQDEVVREIEKNHRPFFDRVRRLSLEGMFSDPHYGGNTNYAGWDLIRYPGPRLAASESDQALKTSTKPVRASAYGALHGH
jgi:gluconate 2-dehydrogenase gamma chain